MKTFPNTLSVAVSLLGLAGIAGSMLAHAQETATSGTTTGPVSVDMATQLQAIEKSPTVAPSSLPDGGMGATFYSAQCPYWPPLPGNIYGVSMWSLGDNCYLLDDLAISYTNDTSATTRAMSLMASPMVGGFSPVLQTQSGVPYLTIAPTGTNALLLTVYNDLGPTNYEIWTTPVLINASWTMVTNGVSGQTNFAVNMGQFATGFYCAILDTNNIPIWELADPNNPNSGILTVFIDSPTNGAIIQ
jgi:hypothetical protein